MDRNERWLIGGTGAALILLFAAIALCSELAFRIPRFLLLYAAAFIAYLGAIAAVMRSRGGGPGWKLILAVAILCRIVLIPAEPQLSTDIYRYLWEGRVIAAGENPFALAPDAPELDGIRDENYEGVSHKDMQTIYPPLSQAVFTIGALIRNDLATQKSLFILFDIGTILVLFQLLRVRGQKSALAIVYAWNPLVIFETAHSGHLDAIGIFFLVLGIYFLARERRAWSAVAIACSFLAKYLAVVLLPYVLLRRRFAVWVPLVLVIAAIGYLPFASAATGLIASLRAYGAEWSFNGLIYNLGVGMIHDPVWTRRVLGAGAVAYMIVQAVRQRDVARYTFHAIAAVLLVAPTLYPWYVAWIVPFLCLFYNRAWILFTGLVFLSYHVWTISVAGGDWQLPRAIYAAEYVPFYGLLIYDAIRNRRRDEDEESMVAT